MNDREVSALTGFIEERLFEPGINWPKHYFNQRSYARWAAYEILERIMTRPLDDPALVVEEFMLKMIAFSNMSEDPHKKFIFANASSTANEILDIFAAMN